MKCFGPSYDRLSRLGSVQAEAEWTRDWVGLCEARVGRGTGTYGTQREKPDTDLPGGGSRLGLRPDRAECPQARGEDFNDYAGQRKSVIVHFQQRQSGAGLALRHEGPTRLICR